MIARISTYLDCTEELLWEKISDPQSLQFIASPILKFQSSVRGDLEREWIIGKSYELKLYFLGIFPLGRHTIKIVTADRDRNTIVSNETGLLTRVWNHTIRFSQATPTKLIYTDEIQIEAGLLTAPIWIFAHCFFRYRQKRWKLLLK
jgi:hypothetical protein